MAMQDKTGETATRDQSEALSAPQTPQQPLPRRETHNDPPTPPGGSLGTENEAPTFDAPDRLSAARLGEIEARVTAATVCPEAKANGRMDGQHTWRGSFTHIECELCRFTRPRGERVEETAALVAEIGSLRAQLAAASEYRLTPAPPNFTPLIVRRDPAYDGTRWAVLHDPGDRSVRRAWTAEGWRMAYALTAAKTYCWLDAEQALDEARQLAAGRGAVAAR